MAGRDDGMAYGHYSGNQGEESERSHGDGGSRSLLGSTMRMVRDKYNAHSQSQSQQQQPPPPQQQYQPPPQQQMHHQPHHQQHEQQHHMPGTFPGQPASHGQEQPQYQQQYPGYQQQQQSYGGGSTHGPNPSYHGSSHDDTNKPPKSDLVSGLLGKVQNIGSDVAQRIGSNLDPQAYATYGPPSTQSGGKNRFGSFAPERNFNDAKWYVDGCSYMWAVSRALETAKESIWILDWWLSPELYLRRPPAKNEQYRLDRMLHAAAQRGVKINIIVYKEVTQALSLCSHHTKHHLENMHPNIALFRYPDHLPDRQSIHSNIMSSFQNMTLNAAGIAKLSGDALKGAYGMHDDVILYWAHHEKLCLIDGKTAFMGGLDLCYGRWDTHQHSIADVHPNDIKQTVFPGQDYNNARVLDFQDVVHWEDNKLDRKDNSRMGWSDVALSLHGPAVEDLRKHFVDRWNYIYDQKYAVRQETRYTRLVLYQRPISSSGHHGASQQPGAHGGGPAPTSTHTPPPQGQQQWTGQSSAQQYPPQAPPGNQSPTPGTGNQPPPPGSTTQSQPYFAPPPSQIPTDSQTRGFGDGQSQHGGGERSFPRDIRGLKDEVGSFGKILRGQLAGQVHQYQDRYFSGHPGQGQGRPPAVNMSCQVVRSCSKWSYGGATESSIAEAYATVIRESEHFVYIENQFFITATGNSQQPVKNQIGAAIVERILRAARAGQKYKILVVIPAVPGFPGDLREEGSLGTRAIMEFQYESINRGGQSILEMIAKEGFNPMEYIRFYNLRSYDRINANKVMRDAEKSSGVSYGQAQQQYDGATTNPTGSSRVSAFDTTAAYPQYQQAAHSVSSGPGNGRWNSVSECYMLGGEDIRNVPWEHPGDVSEIDAFVSEELYVHSKVLIADDRTVICGSANINDRSQLGYHDSEIALIIQDPTAIESKMNGQPWPVSRYAATLRRQLCRKHLGLVPMQNYERPDANFEPVGVPNAYDINSPEDLVVADPLSDTFQSLWNTRAKQNMEVFRKVFHAVPDDTVRNWNDYKEFYEYYFRGDPANAENNNTEKRGEPARYQWGHVVRDDFSPGPEGVREVKEELSKIKGTLVEMPLMFLLDEDIAQEGLGLNQLTQEIYT